MRSARSASRVLAVEFDVEEVLCACVWGGACPSDPSLIAVVLKAELGVPLQQLVLGSMPHIDKVRPQTSKRKRDDIRAKVRGGSPARVARGGRKVDESWALRSRHDVEWGTSLLAKLERAWTEKVDLKLTVCPIVESRQVLIEPYGGKTTIEAPRVQPHKRLNLMVTPYSTLPFK